MPRPDSPFIFNQTSSSIKLNSACTDQVVLNHRYQDLNWGKCRKRHLAMFNTVSKKLLDQHQKLTGSILGLDPSSIQVFHGDPFSSFYVSLLTNNRTRVWTDDAQMCFASLLPCKRLLQMKSSSQPTCLITTPPRPPHCVGVSSWWHPLTVKMPQHRTRVTSL